MLIIPSPLVQLQESRTKRIAVLFRITREDGTIKYFTLHDTNIPYGGQTYVAAGAATASARRWQAALKESTFDIRGALDNDEITDDDLHARKYDNAMVEEILVDWRYPWLGAYATHFFWIDKITRTAEYWVAEMSGPSRFLRRKIGGVLSRNCTRTLGDSLCTINLTAFTVNNVAVQGTEDGDRKLVIFADPTTLTPGSDDAYAYGYLTFTSGNNQGLSENIKRYRASDRRIELQGPMPFTIDPEDEFDLILGCDKLFTTCQNTFTNEVNYGGWLYMPGTDRVLRAPSRR